MIAKDLRDASPQLSRVKQTSRFLSQMSACDPEATARPKTRTLTSTLADKQERQCSAGATASIITCFSSGVRSRWPILAPTEGASLVPVVQPESAKPTASGAIKLKLDICKARCAVVATCPFWMSAPRAKQGMRPLFADEVRPCSIYGAVGVLEARLRTASCL